MPAELTNPYDEFLAEIYDTIFPKHDDLTFLASMAQAAGERVLEPACGTGRVLVHLAREGFSIDGFDISEPMLGVARRRLTHEPQPVQDRITLQHGDMLTHSLPSEAYSLAIIAFSSIYHAADADQRVEIYSRCRSALKPNGTLVIDNNFWRPTSDRTPAAAVTQSHGHHVLPDGTGFDLEIRTQPPWPAMHYSRTLLLRGPDGVVFHEHEIVMEYAPPHITLTELLRAGFGEVEAFDGYTGGPVTVDQIRTRQVFVARTSS